MKVHKTTVSFCPKPKGKGNADWRYTCTCGHSEDFIRREAAIECAKEHERTGQCTTIPPEWK